MNSIVSEEVIMAQTGLATFTVYICAIEGS